jgi:hypothetical protein
MRNARQPSCPSAAVALVAVLLLGMAASVRAGGYLIAPGPGTDIAVRGSGPYTGSVDVVGYFAPSDSFAIMSSDTDFDVNQSGTTLQKWNTGVPGLKPSPATTRPDRRRGT